MKLNTRFWLLFSLFNLFIVALLGTLMRYKIGYPFPHFDQKHLQHAHSHFAFIGWITHSLFVLMVHVIQNDQPDLGVNKYRILIIANLVCAYGMVFTFSHGGYSPASITLSTISIFISYIFAFFFIRDLIRGGYRVYRSWFTASLIFVVLSSIGTFMLAYMKATHNFDQKMHLASLYYYLHFQYNGFFTFACFGLLLYKMGELLPGFRYNSMVFWLFFAACIPAYFLSVLWIKIPLWMYVLVVLSALAQVWAWAKFLLAVKSNWKSRTALMKKGYYLLLIIVMALSVKLLLQLGSTIPVVSKMAFGFRSIIIAYLHLVLLAIISAFIITYMYVFNYIQSNKLAVWSIALFVAGVYLNEIILGIQGVASFSYTPVPFANDYLFIASCIISLSVALLIFSQRKRLITS
jgi:hypothetical protein